MLQYSQWAIPLPSILTALRNATFPVLQHFMCLIMYLSGDGALVTRFPLGGLI